MCARSSSESIALGGDALALYCGRNLRRVSPWQVRGGSPGACVPFQVKLPVCIPTSETEEIHPQRSPRPGPARTSSSATLQRLTRPFEGDLDAEAGKVSVEQRLGSSLLQCRADWREKEQSRGFPSVPLPRGYNEGPPEARVCPLGDIGAPSPSSHFYLMLQGVPSWRMFLLYDGSFHCI